MIRDCRLAPISRSILWKDQVSVRTRGDNALEFRSPRSKVASRSPNIFQHRQAADVLGDRCSDVRAKQRSNRYGLRITSMSTSVEEPAGARSSMSTSAGEAVRASCSNVDIRRRACRSSFFDVDLRRRGCPRFLSRCRHPPKRLSEVPISMSTSAEEARLLLSRPEINAGDGARRWLSAAPTIRARSHHLPRRSTHRGTARSRAFRGR